MSDQYKKLEKRWAKFMIAALNEVAEMKIHKLKKKSQQKHEWNLHWKKISFNSCLSWKYVKANLDKPWDWERLSSNENITLDIINANPDKPWKLLNICSNPNITTEFIQEHSTEIFSNHDNFKRLACNKNVRWENFIENENFMEKHSKDIERYFMIEDLESTCEDPAVSLPGIISNYKTKFKSYNFKQIPQDLGFIWDMVLLHNSINEDNIKNYNDPWFWKILSKNIFITSDTIKANIDKDWDWYYLSDHPNITWDIVEANLDKDWNFSNLSRHLCDLTSKILEDNLDKDWDWLDLSWNNNITTDIIEAHLDKPWDWRGLSYNPNMTMEFIEANLDKDWNWYYLSSNPNITLEFIKANLDKPWDWSELSIHPNITWKFIKANSDQFWDMECLSQNQCITWNIIAHHPHEDWDWYYLDRNLSIKLSAINQLRLKIIKSNIIKRYWRNYSCNPIYPFAQKMILKRAELSS